MALTNPIICHYLAEPSPHKKILSQQLTAMVIAYYQNLKAGGKTDYILKRPLYQHEETDQMISVESYLLGEYYTYSEETLIRILNYFNLCQKEKLNPIQKLLDLLMIEDYI